VRRGTFAARLRRCLRMPVLLLLGLAMPLGAAVAESGSLEYAVKATYLYKFAPFVEWPPAAFPSSTSPVNICVLGNDPFGEVLDRAVAGQRIGGRSLAVVRLAQVGGPTACHIMYVAEPNGGTAKALAALRGAPVLTVTDSVGDIEAKGIINFVVQDNRIRFEIDDSAAARNGLTISSKLLNLALAVRPRA
jgi:hypothetical protein